MRVLIADDEPNMLTSIGSFLKLESVAYELAPDGLAAKDLLCAQSFDAAILDIRMPQLDGIQLLRWIMKEGPAIPVIMMSAHGDVRDAVEALRLGAADYLIKPFDPDELLMRLKNAVRQRRLSADREACSRTSRSKPHETESTVMIGESQAMLDIQKLIERAAPTPATVLITGESGTGKEVAARRLHERSGREGPFVAVNLGAIPETLLESELFGYEKGAFTGASERKPGLFELADGGTLFLDEIGEMPQAMQVKILRALQERKVSRLGSTKALPFDARIVAATNRDLEAMVRDGSFREDLYYRVNVLRLVLPPLRERPQDIRALAIYFIDKLASAMGRRGMGIQPQALRLLDAHPFPGNARELQNVLERALIMCDGQELGPQDIQLGHFPRTQSQNAVPLSQSFVTPKPVMSLRELEKEAILASLERNGGKREATAAELGITRRTLLNKLTDYGMKG